MPSITLDTKTLTWLGALFAVIGSIFAGFSIGYSWHYDVFAEKTTIQEMKKDRTLLYLEVRIIDSENWLSYYERQIELETVLSPWETRRYELLKSSITEMQNKKAIIMGLQGTIQ